MAPLTIGASHVGLTVKDLDSSVKFFESLGFTKAGGDASYPSIFVTDSKILITLWKAKTESPTSFDRRTNIGLHHLALKVPSLEKLDEVYEVVKKIKGVKVEFAPRKLEGTGMSHMMCYDPSGCRVEFAHHSS